MAAIPPFNRPPAVVVLCGKRKSGKDHVAALLAQMYVAMDEQVH